MSPRETHRRRPMEATNALVSRIFYPSPPPPPTPGPLPLSSKDLKLHLDYYAVEHMEVLLHILVKLRGMRSVCLCVGDAEAPVRVGSKTAQLRRNEVGQPLLNSKSATFRLMVALKSLLLRNRELHVRTHLWGSCARPCAWCVVRGAWCVVRGAWCVVRGAWCVVRGAWCVVRGAGCGVRGAGCGVTA
jgi:hypothetical protein